MAGGLWAAVLGYCFAYYNTQLQEQRKARIERVNLQLRDLYGPLLACVTATKSAYEAMIRQHSSDGTRAAFQKALLRSPDGPEARAYRVWMSSVLQPLNEKAADIVHGGFSLMEGSTELEAEVLQLVAHVSASRVLLERWAQGELTTTSAISYPDKLEESVRHEFSRIKKRQAELLGVAPLVAPKRRWFATSAMQDSDSDSVSNPFTGDDHDSKNHNIRDGRGGNGSGGIAIRVKDTHVEGTRQAGSSQAIGRQVAAANLPHAAQQHSHSTHTSTSALHSVGCVGSKCGRDSAGTLQSCAVKKDHCRHAVAIHTTTKPAMPQRSRL